jgi:hypothetical protein
MGSAESRREKTALLSARCDVHVKDVLRRLSRTERLSMSMMISKSILEYDQRHFPSQAFLETERTLFGRYASGKGDLATNRKSYLKELLRAKHRPR